VAEQSPKQSRSRRELRGFADHRVEKLNVDWCRARGGGRLSPNDYGPGARCGATLSIAGSSTTDPVYGTLLMCSASILTFSRTWSRPPYHAYGPPVYLWDSASIEASPPSLVTSITRPRIW
jgi:hypothetical protein